MGKERSRQESSDTAFLMQGSLLAIASIISRIVGLLYRMPMTAIIGKRGNDFYGTAFEIYNIILIISSYSIPLAVSKLVAARVAKKETKNAYRVLKGSLVFAACSGGTAALILWFLADYFTGDILKTPLASIALRVLAPVVFIVAIVGVFRGFFQGLHSMLPSAISQIIEQIVNAIVSVLAAYTLVSYGSKVGAVLLDEEGYRAAYGAAGGTLGTAAGALAALIVMLVIFAMYYRRFKRRLLRDHSGEREGYLSLAGVLIVTIIPVLLSTTLYNISGIMDQGIFKNIAHAQGYDAKQISEWWGVFTGQYKVLINVPISIASAIAASSVPSLTTAYHKGDKALVRRQIRSATKFIMIIAFPCTVGLGVLGGPIMQMLFSDYDKTSAMMMATGAVTILFFSLSTLSNGLLQGVDKMRIPVINAVIALVLQTIVLIVAMVIFKLHIYAVILANAFYGLLMCLLNERALYRYTHTKHDWRRTYWIPLEASVMMGLFVYGSYTLLQMAVHSNTFACIVAVTVGVIIYFVAILLMHGITERELRRFPKGYILVMAAKKLHLLA